MTRVPRSWPARLSRLLPVGIMLLLALAFLPARNAQAGTGSFTTVYNDHVFSQLVVDPTNTHIVYAAGSDQNQNVYVFKSFDGGQTFANTSATFAPFSLFAMTIAKIDAQTLYAGGFNGSTKQGVFYLTHNGGATWTAGASGLNGASVQAIVVDPTIASTVYLGTNTGVYKSTDGGVTVAQLSGMGSRSVHALAYDHNNPIDFYAGTDSNTNPGVWKTSDNGNTWTNVNSGLPSGSVLALAFDPTSTQTLYANVAASPPALAKTSNGGGNWAVVNTPGDTLSGIAVDPLNGNNVYVTTSNTALRSADGGSTYVPIYQKGNGPIVVDGASPQDIYIGGAGITSFTSGPPPITVSPTATPVPTATPQPGVNCQLPAGTGSSYTFPQTNHTVSGVWLQYLQTHGDIDILGYPRSEVICDPITGQTVQYFQRVVLEYHPENPPAYQIERRLLVPVLFGGSADAPADKNNPPAGDSYYFTQTGHFVANVAPDGSPTFFKQFFDAHGKEDTFGYPLEEPKQRTGADGSVRWTQRFQAAIMEYHAENDKAGNVPGTSIPFLTYRVQLTLLGDQYIKQNHLPFIPTS